MLGLNCLVHNVSIVNNEKWSDFEYILNIEPIEFADGLNMNCEKERERK